MDNQPQPIIPDVNSPLGATALLCGMRRSGKSNAIAVIAEELGGYSCLLCMEDSEDEYGPLFSRSSTSSSNHSHKEAQQWTTSTNPS